MGNTKVLKDRMSKAKSIGKTTKSMLDEFLTYESPGNVVFTKWSEPPIIKTAKGCRLTDVDGKTYLDCLAGFSAMNIGHGHPRILETINKQYADLTHYFDFPTPARIALSKRITKLTPGDFPKKVIYGLSGSDAAEAAIRAARFYTKKPIIISFFGAYHGNTYGTAGITAKGALSQYYYPVTANSGDVIRFPYAYCYRCAYDKEYPSCGMHCVKAIESMLSCNESPTGNGLTGVNNVAAMIVEPCQCSAGYIAPPPEFLKGLRALADKYGFLLIADEIQCGLGRTGKMWACDWSGIAPDMLLIGKAIGGGFPFSAMVARAEILDNYAPCSHVSTFAGYAMGCAIASTVLDIIEDEHLVENAEKIGASWDKKIKELQEKHWMLGSYSLRGVLLGMEFIKKDGTPATEANVYITDQAAEEGLLAQRNGYWGNRLSFIPPLCITLQDAQEVMDIMDSVLTKAEKKFQE